jgi:hypothetical protein
MAPRLWIARLMLRLSHSVRVLRHRIGRGQTSAHKDALTSGLTREVNKGDSALAPNLETLEVTQGYIHASKALECPGCVP